MNTGNLDEFENRVKHLKDLQKELSVIETADKQLNDSKLLNRVEWKFDNDPGENGTYRNNVIRNTHHEISLFQDCKYEEDLQHDKFYIYDKNEIYSPFFNKYFIEALNKNIKTIIKDMKDMIMKDEYSETDSLKKITDIIMKEI